MAVRKSVVRHFLACERAETSVDGGDLTLRNLMHAIRLLPQSSFPYTLPQITLVAVVTDGHGDFSFVVEFITWDENGDERLLKRSKQLKVNLGLDPLVARALPLRWTGLVIPGPGLYEFRLVSDGDVLASEILRWRAIP